MAEFAAHGANQEEKMAAEKAKKTIVIGHKNPDTDSISKHFRRAANMYRAVPEN